MKDPVNGVTAFKYKGKVASVGVIERNFECLYQDVFDQARTFTCEYLSSFLIRQPTPGTNNIFYE